MTGGVDEDMVPDEHAILDDVDAAILRRLGSAADLFDPVPDGLSQRAQFAVAWTEVEAELAEVTFLAGIEDSTLVGVRGELDQRTLTFSTEDLSVTVMVSQLGRDRRRVDGWVSGAQPDLVVGLRQIGGTRQVTLSPDGRFEVVDVATGPTQFSLEAATGEALFVTPTIDL